MGLDARVRYTKMVIRNSIIQLVQEKPFHKIKLTEVCTRAEINRTTFYKYYKDLYDWKEQLEQECIERTEKVIQSDTSGNLEQLICEQFCEMKENFDLYALISSPNFESSVLERCLAITMEKMDSELKERFLVENSINYKKRWDSYFALYGCRGVIDCWIREGMQESPEELTHYYLERLHSILSNI